MGIDAEIRFKLKDGEKLPEYLINIIEDEDIEILKVNKNYVKYGETHWILNYMRYYGECCTVGPWPYILRIILYLMADYNIEKVWYGGDGGELEEMNEKSIAEITNFWIGNGTRGHHGEER